MSGLVTTLRSHTRLVFVSCVGALLAVTGSVFGAQGSAARAATSPNVTPSASTHMVPAVLSGLSVATYDGPAPTSQILTIGVSVALPDPSGEQALYNELYDPTSSLYQHFLTPSQFASEFGVSSADTAAIKSWLSGGGLTFESSDPTGDYYMLSGDVAQLETLFDVAIGNYSFDGTNFVANDVPPSVPVNLPIDAVAGLDTFRHFSLTSLDKPTAAGLIPNPPSGIIQPGTQTTLQPRDLWGVYNDPTNDPNPADLTSPQNSNVDFGQGQTVGIFGEGETSSVVAQLRLFEQHENFPKVPVRTIETEGGPDSAYGDNSGSVEWYLDTQSITGMAPDISQLDLYFSKSLYDADVFQSFDYWANDPAGPREMNASFGECEQDPTNPATGPLAQEPFGVGFGDELEAVAEPILLQATVEGRTLFSSAGDTGSGCPEVVAPVIGAGNGLVIQPVPDVSYPCTSAFVVCVGGTVVAVNGTTEPQESQRASETSWTFGGGGSSHFLPEPGFQAPVANVDQKCVSTPSGDPYNPLSAPTCRGVPDVADMSGNETGDAYFIYIDGEPSSEGGTSLSSPLMVGQWARVQAGAPKKVQARGGLGFADETIYNQALHGNYGQEFYDITASEYGIGNGAYQPGPGWDYASGWGALNVANFIAAVDDNPTALATVAEAAPEKPAAVVNTVAMSSPEGNATDPISDLVDDPSMDLTAVTLAASASKGITATFYGPGLGALPPDGQSASFYAAWLYNGTVYYAQADEDNVGTFSYSSGSTAGGSYTDTANSAATGSVSDGTITVTIPASEVGTPPASAFLLDPQFFDTLDVGSTAVASISLATVDSADNLVPVSKDKGKSESIGENLQVAP
jgi:pseudomonalisin